MQKTSRIDKLKEVQQQAVEAWASNGHIGTLNMCTGSGKTITSFHCLYLLLDEGKISHKESVAFLAETETRELTMLEEAEQYYKIFKRNPAFDFNISFACYQGKPSFENIRVAILDEIHNCLTKQYIKVFENEFEYIIGLSATIPDLPVDPEIEESETKLEACERLCPIVYTLSLEDGIKNEIVSPYELILHEHVLSKKPDYHVAYKTRQYYTSEEKHYNWLNYVRFAYGKYSDFFRTKCARDAAKLLQNLPSKIEHAKSILDGLTGKTVVFALTLDHLARIIPPEQIVDGKKSKAQNAEIINKFNKGEISVIGSCQKLRQGITLEGVTNCLIVSFFKKEYIFEQIIGRVIRFVPDKIAQVHMLRTEGTMEVTWARDLIKNRPIKTFIPWN